MVRYEMTTERKIAMKTEESQKTNLVAGVILLVIAVAGAWFGYYWYDNYIMHVYTDDAAIDNNHVSVSAKITGRVSQLTADEGDTIKDGQLLVQLDQTDILNGIHQAEAALASAQANLNTVKAGSRPQQIAMAQALVNQAQVNYDVVKKNHERMNGLYVQNLISKQQMEMAEDQLAQASTGLNTAKNSLSMAEEGSTKEQIAAAEAGVSVAEAGLQTAKSQLRNTIINAPISGVIAKRSVLPGEVVQPGQAIFIINDLKHIWVTANFEETKIRMVHLGQSADIMIDAYPNRVFKGHIVQVGADIVPPPLSIGDSTKTTQKIPVKIRFDQASDLKLFVPGMSVEIRIGVK